MKFAYEIPTSFWGLFRSVNRDIYIEALLTIQEEYQYNNYFLSKESCIQILSEMCTEKKYQLEWDELELEEDLSETLPKRILRWLLKTGWLRSVEDYNTMTTNIVIPDYATVMVEAFERLANEPMEETEVYIQNVYATLYSFLNDRKLNVSMLKTALVNTKKLNKVLQDMLHNMDKFYQRLLQKQTYDGLLEEHLKGYVEQVVQKKYHILKTSDNFYIYKMDIKNCLKSLREDESWIEEVRKKESKPKEEDAYRHRRCEDVLEILDQIERGMQDIEYRIANMDKEHSKYIRATLNRLNYLLSEDEDRRGLLIQLLNYLDVNQKEERIEARFACIRQSLHLSELEILSETPLFKRRRRKNFAEDVDEISEETQELSREEVVKLNKISHRYSQEEIENYITMHLTEGILDTEELTMDSEEEFYKLILAYDMAVRKNSRYRVVSKGYTIDKGAYCYPAFVFMEE